MAVLALFAVGCSHVDTGQIDYRVVDTASIAANSSCPEDAKKCVVSLRSRYAPVDGVVEPFTAGDIYSIEIEQIVVGSDILEGKTFRVGLDDSAEFAILANVFEFAADPAEAAQRRFLQSNQLESDPEDTSDVELKLIYYGDDLKARQPFNFSNIPLQQRSEYKGGSIGLQLVVMEVDSQTGPVASLLTTLARFGQKAIPVSSEISDVLFDLGESLFAGGSGDDRLFEYRFVLSRASDDLDDWQAAFVPGRYVLLRTPDRETATQWDDLEFDPSTGRLRKRNGDEVRDKFYIVVNVRRYPEGTPLEYVEFDGWSTVRSALQAADPLSTPLADIEVKLLDALKEQRSENWQSALTNRWSVAEVNLRALSNRHASAENLTYCANHVKNTALRRSDLATRNARDALREFIMEYQSATQSQPNGTSSEFLDPHHDAFVSRVARYFLPWDNGMEAKFADPVSFGQFVGDSANGLTASALMTAQARSRSRIACEAPLVEADDAPVMEDEAPA